MFSKKLWEPWKTLWFLNQNIIWLLLYANWSIGKYTVYWTSEFLLSRKFQKYEKFLPVNRAGWQLTQSWHSHLQITSVGFLAGPSQHNSQCSSCLLQWNQNFPVIVSIFSNCTFPPEKNYFSGKFWWTVMIKKKMTKGIWSVNIWVCILDREDDSRRQEW